MKLANMKVAKRLAMAFGVVIALMLIVSTVGFARLNSALARTEFIVKDRYFKTALFSRAHASASAQGRFARNLVLSKDPTRQKKEVDAVEEVEKSVAADLVTLDKELNTEKGRELFKSLTDSHVKLVAARRDVAKLASEGKSEQAIEALVTVMAPAETAFLEALQGGVKLGGTLMDNEVKNAESDGSFAVIVILATTVFATLMAAVLAWWVTRSITRPLAVAVDVAQRVAAGDLTSKVEVKTTDETGQLLQALKDMNESLGKIVGEVRASTDTITTASSEIAAGNQDLSQRTEEQASSLEETASSMEELTSTVKQNADNACQASQLAASASSIAVKGGAVVGDVVSTMGAISESSKKIADIIGVIDGIAFQTNILALNAAVEAARAGEQGRGFAVVAGEVRNLAQRSAGAAKEIKALIEDSVGKVDSGTKLVDQAGRTMEEVVSSIKRVTDIMAEITAASQEQSSGIEQVNQAVTQMDQVTQQNAALVEEAAAAAESMQQQARQLATAVTVFKLDASHANLAVAAKPVASVRKAPFVERRGPNRPKNVTRLPAASAKPAAVAKSGTDDEWTEF